MSRKFMYLISLILCLSLVATNTAQAELVGWWEFNEGSGDVVLDSSGNENNGTLHDSVAWSDGKIGLALEFDGSPGYVLIPNGGELTLINQGDFTITMWFQ